MDGFKVVEVINKYKECPNCKASYKTGDLVTEISSGFINIKCKCGFYKDVDENNQEAISHFEVFATNLFTGDKEKAFESETLREVYMYCRMNVGHFCFKRDSFFNIYHYINGKEYTTYTYEELDEFVKSEGLLEEILEEYKN